MRNTLAEALSERQQQIVHLAAKGLCDKEIAVKLGIGRGSVKTHWERMRAKLKVHSRLEIIVRGLGLSDIPEDQNSLERILLRHMFDGTHLGIALIDHASNFVETNAAFARIFHYNHPSELLGKTVGDLFPDVLASDAQGIFHEIWSAKLPTTGLWALPDCNGHPVAVKAGIDRLNVGGEEFVLLTVDDVSEQMEREKALRAQQDTFQMCIDNARQYIWTATSDGYVDYCNSWFYVFGGAHPDETRGIGCAALLHAEDLEASRDRWSKAQLHCQPYEAEARFSSVDGSYRWHHIKMQPIKDSSGNVIRWVGCAFDIHSRHQVGEEYDRLIGLLVNRHALTDPTVPALEIA